MNPPTSPKARQWFVRLTDHLPEAFIASHPAELAELYGKGVTVLETATYCRAHLGAARLEPDGPAIGLAIARALADYHTSEVCSDEGEPE